MIKPKKEVAKNMFDPVVKKDLPFPKKELPKTQRRRKRGESPFEDVPKKMFRGSVPKRGLV